MSNKVKAEWCVKWLEANDVRCEIKKDFSVMIYLEHFMTLDITDAEVHYRATLWAEHILSEDV
jgi:hypothetical protein